MLRVLLVANVLYSSWTTDVIMCLADAGLVEPAWSSMILEELVRAAERRGRGRLATGMVGALRGNYPSALIEGWERRVGQVVLPDPDDRHVAAAAIEGECDCVVTYNHRDFPEGELARLGIRALSPDGLVMELVEKTPVSAYVVIEGLTRSKRRPPRTYDEEIEGLRRCGMRRFAEWLDN